MEQENTSQQSVIDENKYSRQLAVYGEAMGKLITMKVLISGIRGIGAELAKNLILAGPKEVVLHDDQVTEMRDLGSNFYLKEGHVGKISRADATIDAFKELNPAVSVKVLKGELRPEVLQQFTVVVITENYNKKQLIEINDFCRNQKTPIGFIYGGSLGLFGFGFVDFGEKFTIFDKDGEQNRNCIVVSVSQDEKAIVTCHEDKRHGFEDGDNVTFREIEGMTELNGKVCKIELIDPFSFKLDLNTKSFNAYKQGGIVEQIKVPFTQQFKKLSESLVNPFAPGKNELDNCDFEKFGRPELLHTTFNALLKFVEKYGGLPKLNDEDDATELVNMTKQINNDNKSIMDIEGIIKLDSIDEEVVKNVARFAKAQISPQCAFWGGFLCQEIIKFTGKFSPLRQWLFYDTFEALPKTPVVDRVLANCRYDDQIAIFGKSVQEKLGNLKIFMVGVGALGCEYLKQFALMGVCCSNQGKFTVTDNDVIEISNLNRQFLFRKQNVGSSKSQVACEAIQHINKYFNYDSLKMYVAPETEEFFNDDFWENQDFVVNALDNIKARMYTDSRCVFYNKALFESGTLGTKCNSQVVLPKLTQSYGDSSDPPEESIPLCTLKNFPYQIEHTIQWARDYFQGEFADAANETVKFLQDPQNVLNKLLQEYSNQINVKRSKLEALAKLLPIAVNPTYEKCIEMARLMFQEQFYNQISQLVHSFPADHKTENGQPFWSGPKRCPDAEKFNPNDHWHFLFVKAAANIFAYTFGLPYLQDDNKIKTILSNIKVPEFVPKQNVKIQVNENEQQPQNNLMDDDLEVSDKLEKQLRQYTKSGGNYKITEFEKDDDSNFHIDFIAATANLRAKNYRIPQIDRFRIKIIAGKIIPAIATTTALVVGSMGMEIYKYVQGLEKSAFKNAFVNLALPMFIYSEPLPPIVNKDKAYDPIMQGPVKYVPTNFSNWDKIIISGPLTLQQLMDQISTQYKVNISMITLGTSFMYNKYAMGKSKEEMAVRLSMNVKDIYEKVTEKKIPPFKKYIELVVQSEGQDDGVDVVMPLVAVKIK